jgi:hypothetical protein
VASGSHLQEINIYLFLTSEAATAEDIQFGIMVVHEEVGLVCLRKLSAVKRNSGSNNNEMTYFQLCDILNNIWEFRLSDSVIIYRKLKVI